MIHPLRFTAIGLCLAAVLAAGCAKGPFWQAGQFAPWVQRRWAEEERLAQTLWSRRADLQALVRSARSADSAAQERAAEKLAEIAANDPVLLMRLEAIGLLGELGTPAAVDALGAVAGDPSAEVRLAVVHACGKASGGEALRVLRGMSVSDTDRDVRLAATRTLGRFPGEASVAALAMALDDPSPAMRFAAMDALAEVTDQKFGRDIAAWRRFAREAAATAAAPAGGEPAADGSEVRAASFER